MWLTYFQFSSVLRVRRARRISILRVPHSRRLLPRRWQGCRPGSEVERIEDQLHTAVIMRSIQGGTAGFGDLGAAEAVGTHTSADVIL